MQTFGRMRLDVENCIRELVAFGVAQRVAGPAARRATRFVQPESDAIRDLLDEFLERRATVSHEDRSPAVQRFREMIGRDEKMLVVFEWIRTAAKSDISVLILGPTGSGKEVVARMIHELSRRGTNKFQAVNCAALPDTLFESEIFGYEKGAFTGAHDRKPGRLELANNGTLFLDEIGDMSLIAQAKLLRVLEERRFERLGGNTPIDVNFRLISATNRAARSVRSRLALPRGSLLPRQRLLDPAALAPRTRHATSPFLRSASWPATAPPTVCRSTARPSRRKPPTCCCSTTGRATSASSRARCRERPCRRPDVSSARWTSSSCTPAKPPVEVSRERLPTLAEAERAHIARVLESVNWNKKQAATVLEISRGTLYRKILEYSMEAEPKPARGRPR